VSARVASGVALLALVAWLLLALAPPSTSPLSWLAFGLLGGIPLGWALDWFHGRAYKDPENYCPGCGRPMKKGAPPGMNVVINVSGSRPDQVARAFRDEVTRIARERKPPDDAA
jgi:hypothetical protein